MYSIFLLVISALIIGLGILEFLHPAGSYNSNAVFLFIAIPVFVITTSVGIFTQIVRHHLLKGKEWARIAAIILSAFLCIMGPLILLGIINILLLSSQEITQWTKNASPNPPSNVSL